LRLRLCSEARRKWGPSLQTVEKEAGIGGKWRNIYHCCIRAVIALCVHVRGFFMATVHLVGGEIGRHFGPENAPSKTRSSYSKTRLWPSAGHSVRGNHTSGACDRYGLLVLCPCDALLMRNGLDCSAGPATTCKAQRGPQLRNKHTDRLLYVYRGIPSVIHDSILRYSRGI
jgi:hypothetical protein